ncbi:hypothetical protein XELAEV_18019350mg [Xenopus laevis]|uniref:Uncharacterized protein n=1 Tax=Xenopus laevis TaxID=8355 RepID=A0A974DFJ5_XENLA|nr:hypothetical protein XELAEV_18019350mg [Xenopus laevis]
MADSLEAQVRERVRQQGSGWVNQLLAELIPPPAAAPTVRSRTAARVNSAGPSRRSRPPSRLSPSPPRRRIRNAARKATATSAARPANAALPSQTLVSTVRPPVTRARAAARAAGRAPPTTATPCLSQTLPAAPSESRSSPPPPVTVSHHRLHVSAKSPQLPAVPPKHTGVHNKSINAHVAPLSSSEDSSPPHDSECSGSAIGGFTQGQQPFHHKDDLLAATHSTPHSHATVDRHGSMSRGADRCIGHSSAGRYQNIADSPIRDTSGRRGSRVQSPVPSCSSAWESPRSYSPSSPSNGSSEDRQGKKRRRTHRGSHRLHSSCRDDTTSHQRSHAAPTLLPSRSGGSLVSLSLRRKQKVLLWF